MKINLKKMNKIRIISLQISEEFVKEYNEANAERKAHLDHQCMQIYEKLKVNYPNCYIKQITLWLIAYLNDIEKIEFGSN